MKQLLLSITLLTSLSLSAQDYYWVGGSGDWSDLSHWATTSGGSTFHTELPSPTNDVYLDANSFTGPDQILNLDLEEVDCHNFYAQDATNFPKVKGNYYLDDLNVYGDIIMPDNVDRSLNTVELLGDDAGNILDLGTLACGGLSFVMLNGTGEYILQSDMNIGNLYLFGADATFNANEHTITCGSRFRTPWNGTTNLVLDNATLYTNEFEMYEGVNAQMDNFSVYLSGTMNWSFLGGGKHYAYVNIQGERTIEDDSSFDTFEVMPGATVTFDAGSTQTADEFIFNGTSDAPIYLLTNTAGEQANIVQSTGTVNATFLVMQDNNASGGATFSAAYSVDNGNNTGWNIEDVQPLDYFWVGGEGNWSDVSHWATTSGGSEFHLFPPSLIDNVFFDANSFSFPSEVVTIAGERTVASIDATAALVGVKLETEAGITNTLTVLGDFNAGALTLELYELNFSGSGESNLSSSSGNMDNTQLRVFNATSLNILSPITINKITLSSGDISLQNQTIECLNSFTTNSTEAGTLNMTNADISVAVWVFGSQTVDALTAGSTLRISSAFNNSINEDYNDVVITGSAYISGAPTMNNLTLEPQADLTLYQGVNIELNSLVANGTEENLIEIKSNEEGVTTSFTFNGGDVTVNYVDLKDNHAIGSGTYTAEASVDGGNTDGWFIDPFVGVEEHGEHALSVYPNPTTGIVNIQHSKHTAQLTIFDFAGRSVAVQQINSPAQIDLSFLPPGSYILSVESAHQTEQQVLLVQ